MKRILGNPESKTVRHSYRPRLSEEDMEETKV